VGVAALAAIAWPGFVLIGLFLGIIPGIVLWLAPSLFVYSLLWWSTRAVLWKIPITARLARNGMFRFAVSALSAAIVATPAILVPYLINMRAEAAVQRLQAGDREPDKPIVLPPIVTLVIDGNYNWPVQKPFCETLCLRLLFNATVAHVIAVDPAHGNATTAFWIERRGTCPAQTNFSLNIMWMTDFPLVRGNTPEDRVRARMARGECLLEGDGRPNEAAMTISYRAVQAGISIFDRPWALELGPLSVNRLEITDASGATIYRRTEVTTAPLIVPLQITTAAGLLTTVTYAGWARSDKVLGKIGPQGRDVLPRVLGAAVRTPEISPPRSPSP
jgi:hypothetical protein